MLTSRPDDSPIEPFDPFFNANTMDDLAQAERLAALDGNPSER